MFVWVFLHWKTLTLSFFIIPFSVIPKQYSLFVQEHWQQKKATCVQNNRFLNTNWNRGYITGGPPYLVCNFVLHLYCMVSSKWHFTNRICGVMVSVLASRAVDRGLESRSGQTKDYEIGICWFSAKRTELRRKSKDWLARNQNNVSEWGNMSIRELLLQWASTIKIQLRVLVYYRVDLIIISLKINLFSPWYSWKIVNLFSSWYSWKIAELAITRSHFTY